ncbi:MAG: dihydroorotate dehydrogenase [Chloroflexi bacterium]|nr:dihydroorotate dehydrogenase [Chloroflexota bacterium]
MPVKWRVASSRQPFVSSSGDRIFLLNLEVQLAPRHPRGLRLRNPVIAASGTFGYGEEFEGVIDIQRLGAIVCKGTTLKAREGNPQPRLAETPCGLLNSIGLENIGLGRLISEKAPVWAGWKTPVIVNIAGGSLAEYRKLASSLEGVVGVAALELNISCPNVRSGGMEFGMKPDLTARVTAAVRQANSLPLIVKLSPNAGDIVSIARAAVREGADALCLINTLKGMAIDLAKKRRLPGFGSGGLSGPAIKPVALYQVYSVSGAVDVPVIGCGGIECGRDALEFLAAGAAAVEVGTASFTNPRATIDILDGLEKHMAENDVRDVGELTGVARAWNIV